MDKYRKNDNVANDEVGYNPPRYYQKIPPRNESMNPSERDNLQNKRGENGDIKEMIIIHKEIIQTKEGEIEKHQIKIIILPVHNHIDPTEEIEEVVLLILHKIIINRFQIIGPLTIIESLTIQMIIMIQLINQEEILEVEFQKDIMMIMIIMIILQKILIFLQLMEETNIL